MIKKPCLKFPKSAMTPPPFGTFPKMHPIWYSHPSLTIHQDIIFSSLMAVKFDLKAKWEKTTLGNKTGKSERDSTV